MVHAFRWALVLLGAVAGIVGASAMATEQGPPNGGGAAGGRPPYQPDPRPMYQRRTFDWSWRDRDWRRDGFKRQSPEMPQASSGWFQRPYPYHLDYYKMRYGGSYAPYFGNLYGTPFGTPQVVNGGWGPGTDGSGPGGGAVPPPGYEWMDAAPYANGYSPGQMIEQSVQPVDPNVQTGTEQPKSEALPAPKK